MGGKGSTEAGSFSTRSTERIASLEAQASGSCTSSASISKMFSWRSSVGMLRRLELLVSNRTTYGAGERLIYTHAARNVSCRHGGDASHAPLRPHRNMQRKLRYEPEIDLAVKGVRRQHLSPINSRARSQIARRAMAPRNVEGQYESFRARSTFTLLSHSHEISLTAVEFQ